MSSKIIFYISGHGYGHVTRSQAVMQELLRRRKGLEIIVRTDAPAFLFERHPHRRILLSPKRVDVGVLQDNSFIPKKKETLEAYLKLLSEQSIEEEAGFIADEKPDLIVGDIPPLAFAAAARAKVPSIALGNFSWDWILAPYARKYRKLAGAVAQIRTAYRHAQLLLRLPFHGNMSVFRKIKEIPLIARKANLSRKATLRKLGISPAEKRKIILFSFGKSDFAHIDFTQAAAFNDCLFILFNNPEKWLAENVKQIALSSPVPFPDVVAACDAVVTKPGYGILSECLANQTPILYTSRDGFVEYPILVDAIQKHLPNEYVARRDLFSGNWGAPLSRLWKKPRRFKSLRTDGAAVAAAEILKFL